MGSDGAIMGSDGAIMGSWGIMGSDGAIRAVMGPSWAVMEGHHVQPSCFHSYCSFVVCLERCLMDLFLS